MFCGLNRGSKTGDSEGSLDNLTQTFGLSYRMATSFPYYLQFVIKTISHYDDMNGESVIK